MREPIPAKVELELHPTTKLFLRMQELMKPTHPQPLNVPIPEFPAKLRRSKFIRRDPVEFNRELNYPKLMKTLLDFLRKLANLKLTPKDLLLCNLFPENCLQFGQESLSFQVYVKTNQCKMAENLLAKNRYLVYDSDNVRLCPTLTPDWCHWPSLGLQTQPHRDGKAAHLSPQ